MLNLNILYLCLLYLQMTLGKKFENYTERILEIYLFSERTTMTFRLVVYKKNRIMIYPTRHEEIKQKIVVQIVQVVITY